LAKTSKAVQPARRIFKFTTFDALQYRDFRFLWASQVGSTLTQQTETYTRAWLVIQLTDTPASSALFIGLVHLTRFIGAAAMLVGGVLSDRMDRRYILIVANLINASFFTVLAVLILFDIVTMWHVVVSAIVAGAAQSVDETSRQAAISSIVPREGIMNAISLSAVLMGVGNTVGPAIAGFMIAFVGTEGSYFAMSIFLVVSTAFLLFIQPLKVRAPVTGVSFFTSLKDGYVFAFRTPAVRAILLVGFTVVMFGAPHFLLLPVYFKEVLGQDARALAWLAIPGILSIFGGLIAASLGDYKRKGLMLYLAVLSPATAAIILSQVNVLWLAIIATSIFGIGRSQYQPTSQTGAMKATPDHLRGRVASALSLSSQAGSVGVLIYGLLASQFGIQGAYLIAGVTLVGLQTSYFILMPAFRRLT
jgi:MFS family permease